MNTVEIQICYFIRFSPEKSIEKDMEGDILDALLDSGVSATTDFIEVAGQTFEVDEEIIFDNFCVSADFEEEKNSVYYYVQIFADSDWYYGNDVNNHILPTLKDVANALLSVNSPITTNCGIELELDVRVSHFTVPSHDDPEGELEIIPYSE